MEYNTIEAFLKLKRYIPSLASALILFVFVYVALRSGIPDFYAAAILMAAVVFFLTRLIVELVVLLADMLLPK
ncbi:MAG: hypothetical protein RIB57_17640 [Pelagibacterium sp.]|uniref:hypothetical protein n=1 Tax=Pelagibacterium sp. TaxID=1967288 RepID=UPI0032EB64CD